MNPLQRTIHLPHIVALYVGAVMGSGILLVPGLAAQIAGPASLIAWGAMIIFILPIALSMGWLSHQYPNVGGVAHFVKLAFGELASIHVGWYFLMSVAIGAPITAIAGAQYLCRAMGWGRGEELVIASSILLIGLFINYRGMKLSGNLQVVLIVGIVAVLLFAIFGSIPRIKADAFQPFFPHGWFSVGQAAVLLFWCFIGWEAVSHMSEEFVNPKDAVKGVIIAAILVGVLYFSTAFATIGTQSYKENSAFIQMLEFVIGRPGRYLTGVTCFFICTATVIAYVGAASRLAYALSKDGNAPKFCARISSKHHSPVGGLTFLAFCFAVGMVLYSFQFVSLSELILFPNASLILTYFAGCLAGVILLRDSKAKRYTSILSTTFILFMIPFIGWAILYPVLVSLLVWIARILRKDDRVNRASKTKVHNRKKMGLNNEVDTTTN
jgi:amino acid efflux transporter